MRATASSIHKIISGALNKLSQVPFQTLGIFTQDLDLWPFFMQKSVKLHSSIFTKGLATPRFSTDYTEEK